MRPKRLVRAGVAVLVLSALVLAGTYAADIALRYAADHGQPPRRPQSVPQPTIPTPASNPIATTTGIPAPDQAVLIADLRAPEARVLAVDASGSRVGSAPLGADEARRFRLAPLRRGGDRFLLKTATLRPDGEPDCLARADGTLVTTACDADAPAQIFQFSPAGADTAGRHLFNIRTGGHAVKLDGAGSVRVDAGGAGSAFAFVPWNAAEDPFD